MPDDENPSARAKPPIFLQDQRFAVPERGHEQLIPVLSGQRPAAANALLTAEEQRREGLRWLGQLRWWALTGALAGTLIAMSFGWSFVSPPAIAAGVVLMVLVNGVLVWRVRSSGKPGNIGQDELLLHSTADLLLLTWLLAWAGGVRNPLSVSYSFHVVLGALLSGRRGALVSSGVSLACISFLWVLEDQGRLPSLALERPPALLWALSMVMLVVGLCYLALVVAERLFTVTARAREKQAEAERSLVLLLDSLAALKVGLELKDQEGQVQLCNETARALRDLPAAREGQAKLDVGGRAVVHRFAVKEDGGERIIDLLAVAPESVSLRAFLYVDRTDELLVEQRHVMLERLATLGRALQGVAHELNTPLTTMQTLAKDLLEAR